MPIDNCKTNPECTLPEKMDNLSDKFDILSGKVDEINTCITIISHTLHGNREFDFSGIVSETKRNKEKIEEIDGLLGFNRFFKDFWSKIKPTLYILVVLALISFIGLIISIKLDMGNY